MEHNYFNPSTNKKFNFVIFKSELIHLCILVIDGDKYFIGQDEIYEDVFNWISIDIKTGQLLLDEKLEWLSLLDQIDISAIKLITDNIEKLI